MSSRVAGPNFVCIPAVESQWSHHAHALQSSVAKSSLTQLDMAGVTVLGNDVHGLGGLGAQWCLLSSFYLKCAFLKAVFCVLFRSFLPVLQRNQNLTGGSSLWEERSNRAQLHGGRWLWQVRFSAESLAADSNSLLRGQELDWGIRKILNLYEASLFILYTNLSPFIITVQTESCPGI